MPKFMQGSGEEKDVRTHTHTNTLRTYAFRRHVLGVRARQSQSTLSNLTP